MGDLHAAAAGDGDDARAALLGSGERIGERLADLGEPAADEPEGLGPRVEEAQGAAVQQAHALLVVERHDAGRRGVEDFLQERVLLFGPQSLLAQPVDHLVVDADQLVELRLADLEEVRREVALTHQLGAGAHHAQGDEQRADEDDARGDGDDEEELDGEKQTRLLREHEPGDGPQHDVEGREVDDDLRPKGHRARAFRACGTARRGSGPAPRRRG